MCPRVMSLRCKSLSKRRVYSADTSSPWGSTSENTNLSRSPAHIDLDAYLKWSVSNLARHFFQLMQPSLWRGCVFLVVSSLRDALQQVQLHFVLPIVMGNTATTCTKTCLQSLGSVLLALDHSPLAAYRNVPSQ